MSEKPENHIPRQMIHRNRVIAAGGEIAYVVLSAQGARDLSFIRKKLGLGKSAAVHAALSVYASQLGGGR